MPNDTPHATWWRLRVLRERTGMSLTDLSKGSGISLSYLSDLENGKREPNARVTKLLAQALNVPIAVIEKEDRIAGRRSVIDEHKPDSAPCCGTAPSDEGHPTAGVSA